MDMLLMLYKVGQVGQWKERESSNIKLYWLTTHEWRVVGWKWHHRCPIRSFIGSSVFAGLFLIDWGGSSLRNLFYKHHNYETASLLYRQLLLFKIWYLIKKNQLHDVTFYRHFTSSFSLSLSCLISVIYLKISR